MPNIYGYKGLKFFFYSNEHTPANLHIKRGGEILMRAENLGGKKWKVEVERNVKISNKEISDGIEFLESFNDKILKKWDIYFSGKQPRFEQITRIPKKGSKKSK